MDELKNPKYLIKLKETSSKFEYKVTDNGDYYIDYDNGLSQIDNVVDKLKTLTNDLNTVSEDVKTMLKSYVLDDSVNLNEFVIAVNGGMNGMASQMSTTIQEILTEAKNRMESAQQLDQEYIANQTAKTNEIDDDSSNNNSSNDNKQDNGLENSENPEENQDELFDSLDGVDYSNSQCGKLARIQLENMGLVAPDTANAHGKNFAYNLANGSAVINDGYTAKGYPSNASTQEQVFDQIVSENGGHANNIVLSFNSKGHYRKSGEYGHVIVVSEVKDGRVYLIDNNNTSWSNKETQTLDLSVEEFKQHYLREGNEVNYMTQIN